MADAPSQIDLFDYKPKMGDLFDKDLPDSIRNGPAAHHDDLGPEAVPDRPVDLQVRRSTASPAPGSASCCRTPAESSTTSRIVKTVHTEAINHDPAITYIMTGSQLPGPAEHGRLALLRPGQR